MDIGDTPFQGLVAKPPNRLCSALPAPLRVASEEVDTIIAKPILLVKVVLLCALTK